MLGLRSASPLRRLRARSFAPTAGGSLAGVAADATMTAGTGLLERPAFLFDFSGLSDGDVVPDLGRASIAGDPAGHDHRLVARDSAVSGVTGGRVLALEGNGAASRSWYLQDVPVEIEQQVHNRFRIPTLTGHADGTGASGAIVSQSTAADNSFRQYGARLVVGAQTTGVWGLQLWKYNDSGFGGLGGVDATGIVEGEWVHVVLERIADGSVRAKWWRDVDPEPGAWNLTAAHDAQIPAGYAGLYVNNTATGVEIDILSAATGGAAAPRSGTPTAHGTPTTPAVSGAVIATDWEDQTPTDNPPSGWETRYVDQAWTVTDDSGNLVVRQNAASDRAFLVPAAMDPASGTQEILARVRSAAATEYGNGIAVCIEDGPNDDSGYAGFLSSSGVALCRFVDGSFSDLGRAAAAWVTATGVWFWMRLRYESGSLYLRIWRDDEPEPLTWQLVVADASLTSGYAGLYHFAAHQTDYDDVQIAGSLLMGPAPDFVEDFSTYTDNANFKSDPRGIHSFQETAGPITLDQTQGYGGRTQCMRYDWTSFSTPGAGGTTRSWVDMLAGHTKVFVRLVQKFSSNFQLDFGFAGDAAYKHSSLVGISNTGGHEIQTGFLSGDAFVAAVEIFGSTGVPDDIDPVYGMSNLRGDWRVFDQYVDVTAALRILWIDGVHRYTHTGWVPTGPSPDVNSIIVGQNINERPVNHNQHLLTGLIHQWVDANADAMRATMTEP